MCNNRKVSDDVNQIVASWQRERPDLDVAPLEVWSRIRRLNRRVDEARIAAQSSHRLESWEFDVLAALRRAGKPYQLTPGQLLSETFVTSGTMTNRIDRMSARGLVARRKHPSDARLVLVELLPAGRELVDAALADLLAAEEQLLAGLDADQRGALVGMLGDLLSSLQRSETSG